MLRDDFNAGIDKLKRYDLRYDLLIFAHHLPQAIKFGDRHPDQMFIVDHMVKPRIAEGEIAFWRRHMAALSERENVCKISGMVTEANWHSWTPEQLRPYFDAVLAAFGASRLMFGSDWPVLTVASTYQRWLSEVKEMIRDSSDTEAEAIMHGTATKTYGLTPLESTTP